MRKAAIVAMLLVAASLPAGRSVPAAPGEGFYPEIQSLLDRRARAVLDGHRGAFMATIDRENPAFLKRQRLLFGGFQKLGLSEYELEVSDRVFPELTTGRETIQYGEDADPTILNVEERYAIEGYDRQPALEDLFLTFIRGPDGWRIAADDDLDDLTLFSGRKLWEEGPIVTRESEHFLYVSHPDLADAAAPALAGAERALRRVNERWPREWNRNVIILAPSDSKELARILQASFDLGPFVAFAFSGVERARDWDLVGHRVILNWPQYSRYGNAVREDILTHELLHVATRELAGPHVTAWVDEGVAEWVSGGDTSLLTDQVRRGTFDRRLPRDFEFVTGDETGIGTSYQESNAAIRYAADRFGPGAVARFYAAAGRPRLAPGTWRYHVGRAARAAFGLGYGAFERRWANWTEETLG